MAEAMEEYEKEAGCVPILHPEVGSFVCTPRGSQWNPLGLCSPALFTVACFGFPASLPLLPAAALGGGIQLATLRQLALAPPPLLRGHQTLYRCWSSGLPLDKGPLLRGLAARLV